MKKQKINILNLLLAGVIMIAGGWFAPREAEAIDYCITARCKKAKKDAAEAARKAAEAAGAANNLQGEIKRLKAKVTGLEADIAANQAVVVDLATRIKEAEGRLKKTQSALAELLLDLHFSEKPEGIMLLAGSETISEMAEKRSRLGAAREQIKITALTIKDTKEKLERQKREIERILAEEESQKTEIVATKQRSEYLEKTYRNNAKAFSEAQKRHKKIQQEEEEEIRRLNSIGYVGNGVNNYPLKNRCPRDNNMGVAYAGNWCQCTSYAGWKAYSRWGFKYWTVRFGHAKTWGARARAAGYKVTNTPALHTVAANTNGYYGHVMWVEKVYPDGSIDVSEYNNSYSSKSGLPGDFGYRSRVPRSHQVGWEFIHFN